MKAYYGSQELKNELMFEISEHERLDHYLQVFNDDTNTKRQSAIGSLCVDEYYGNPPISYLQRIEKIYNIPFDLLMDIDNIFEFLSSYDSKKWSARVFGSIKVGQDLTYINYKYKCYIHNSPYVLGYKTKSNKLIEIIKGL